MAFIKYSILFAVVANVYALAAPQFPYPSPPPLAVVHHAPPPPPPPPPPPYYHAPVVHSAAAVVPIVSQSYDANPDGSYTFSFESGDGTSRQEQGVPRAPPSPPGHPEVPGGVAVQGRFSYASPEGPVQVEYIADENGYQPSGSNIHPEILKAVAAQVAFARSEGGAQRVAYAAPHPAYHPPPPPPPPVAVVHHAPIAPPPPPFGHYPYKA